MTCRKNKSLSMCRHREWFDDVGYESVLQALETMRAQCAGALNEVPGDIAFAGSCGRVNALEAA